MDEMLALLGDHPPCFLFDQLFLERLPEDIRIQLVDIKTEDHRALALKADSLWASRDSNQVFTTNAVQRSDHTPKGRKLYGKPKFAESNDPPIPNQLCFYHRTFGEAARRCRQPCAWSGNDKVSR